MRPYAREFAGFTAVFVSILFFTATMVMAAGSTVPTGRKIFETKCAQCHGKDGKGNPKMVKVLKVDAALVDLTASKLNPEETLLLVTNGKKKMPKWKGKLTPDQIQSVVEYVGSFRTAPASAK